MLLIDKDQCNRLKIIYEGVELPTKEVQWLDLDTALAKIEGSLLEA